MGEGGKIGQRLKVEGQKRKMQGAKVKTSCFGRRTLRLWTFDFSTFDSSAIVLGWARNAERNRNVLCFLQDQLSGSSPIPVWEKTETGKWRVEAGGRQNEPGMSFVFCKISRAVQAPIPVWVDKDVKGRKLKGRKGIIETGNWQTEIGNREWKGETGNSNMENRNRND